MTTGSIGRVIRLIAIAGLAGAFLALGASQASAHYKLKESTPAAGATLEAAPEQLTLVFSGPLIDSPVGTLVEVKDASGKSFSSGKATVAGDTVTQALRGAPSGAITVNWKVIFDDGHPVANSYAFTVTPPAAAASDTSSPSAAASDTASPADAASPSTSTTPVETSSGDGEEAAAKNSNDEDDSTPWIPIVLGLAVVGVIGAVVANRLRGSRAASA